MSRAPALCNECGQNDSDPKVHLFERTVHHDCLTTEERAVVIASSPIAEQIVQACEGGLRGDALLDFIQSLHTEEPA